MTNDFKPAKAGGNQPRLSKEEYAEKKRAEKEKVYQMIDDAAREIVSDPEKFKSFLDTQSRMDRYSAANALLIYSQYPQATQLKDFDDWGNTITGRVAFIGPTIVIGRFFIPKYPNIHDERTITDFNTT